MPSVVHTDRAYTGKEVRFFTTRQDVNFFPRHRLKNQILNVTLILQVYVLFKTA